MNAQGSVDGIAAGSTSISINGQVAAGVREIYETIIRRLPVFERLRLAAMILGEVTSTDIGHAAQVPIEEDDNDDLSAFAPRALQMEEAG